MKKILYLGLDPRRYPHEGELFHLSLIHTHPRPFEGRIKEAFEKLHLYTHVLFTSRTPLPIYQEYAFRAHFPKEALAQKIYLCIGKGSAAGLEEVGLKATAIAQEETGEGVITLLETAPLQQGHLFFPRSAQGRKVILHYLEKKGIPFTHIDLYETHPLPVDLPNLDDFDEIVFTSPSTVHAFSRLVQRWPSPEKCLPLGPITKKTLNTYLSGEMRYFFHSRP
jgi:uroporphyrinogen-III synthase